MDARARKRRWLFAAALGGTAAAFMAAVSCLPDISTATVTPFDAGDVVAPPPAGFCGDGVIDYDAGEHCDPADSAASGCAACQVTCDGGFVDPVTDHCYFGLTGNGQYEQAQNNCANAGGHLVTFASEDEFIKVANWKGQADFWVGLQYDNGALAYAAPATVGEPGWSGHCDGCYAHVDAGAANIPKRDPDAGGIKATACVLAGKVASPWFSLACDIRPLPLGVVCEREPIGAAVYPCGFGGRCLATYVGAPRHYVYIEQPATAAAAADGCKSIGARLVVFETREEREELSKQLLTFVPSSPAPQIWIGLARVNGVWTWADGTTEDKLPLEWADNQPKGGFFAWLTFSSTLYDTQLVHSDDGTSAKPYVCEVTN